MKPKEFSEYQGMSIDELREQVDGHRLQIFKMREKKVVEELSNPYQIRAKRREVAQLKTLIRQKELAVNPKKARKRKKR